MNLINKKIHLNSECVYIDPDELKMAPFKTNDPNNPDANNGLITSIWGPHEWNSIHYKTFGYPIKPTKKQKQEYLEHFISEGNVLPCIYCRASYQQFIKEGDTKLDMSVMESRETLTKWAYRLHNKVNEKLGIDYGETYEELCYKFESSRAKCTKSEKGCIMPLNIKARSFQKAEIHRAPIIDKKYSFALIKYAKNMKLEDFDDWVKYYYNKNDLKLHINNFEEHVIYYSRIDRNSMEWSQRDCIARQIIDFMRRNGISSLTKKGLPSFHEMMLIALISSNLEKVKLEEIYDKITSNKKNIE